MKANNKIYVARYLRDLNERAKHACIYHDCNKQYINPITCKELAKRCEVTPATIANLTTSSKFYLLYRVAEEIYDAYYAYFLYDENTDRKENPDDIIYPRDKNYILMCLTNYYTEEFIDGCQLQ